MCRACARVWHLRLHARALGSHALQHCYWPSLSVCRMCMLHARLLLCSKHYPLHLLPRPLSHPPRWQSLLSRTRLPPLLAAEWG